MTTITYNEKQIDFGDLDAFFAIEPNFIYFCNTLDLCRTLQPETITPLNPSDPNYMLFVKSLVYIHETRTDLVNGFCLEFNSHGRPFQQVRKQLLTNDQKINFKKKLVHSNNNCTFVPLSDKSENNDMAKKAKTETAIALIESTAATKLFESTSAKLSLVLAKCAEVAITSPEQAEAVTANAKELKAIIDDGDALRKEVKDPYYKAGVTIDAAFKAVIGDAPAVLDKQKQLLGAWNQVLAAEKAKRDAEANALRQAEEAKKQLAQTEVGQIGLFLITHEKNCIEAIASATDAKQLGGIWKSSVEPYLNFGQFKSLATIAEGVITRISAFGHAKAAALTAPSPVKDQIFAIEKSKAIVAAQNAETQIYQAIKNEQSAITVVAEVAKSEITQAQIADKVETVVETRRSPIKYEVIDITLCPADFTMTVINEDYMKKVISEHAAAIDANPLIVPGIRFYRDAIVKL